MFEPPVSYAEAISCSGKQKYAVAVYHAIWAKFSEDVDSAHRRPAMGSAIGEVAEWAEDSLKVAYKGAILAPSLQEQE